MRSNLPIALLLFCVTAHLLFSFRVQASEPANVENPIAKQINQAIQSRIDQEKIAAAPLASESTQLRRLTLDLAGRIPTRKEIEQYASLPESNRYQTTVDRLMSSVDYSYHLRNELDVLLLASMKDDSEWRNYLLRAAQQNRSWRQIFEDVMLPDGSNEETKASAKFLGERIRDIDKMTNDTAVLFFGVNISCAQCHDHPLVSDWEQKHFYGMKSFFNRTYKTKKDTLAEKYEGTVKFKTVAGKEYEAEFMFLNGTAVEEPKVEKTDEQRKAEQEEVKRQMKEKDAPPAKEPDFSPRRELVSLALTADSNGQNYLARSIVNRTWARLTGHGFVEPLDQLHSENPASHPELFAWLTRDFIENGYDLKRLIHGMVLSDPYRRSSTWYSDDEPPSSQYFAVAKARPLSRHQLSLSLIIGTSSPEWMAEPAIADHWDAKRNDFERQSESLTRLLEIPDEKFQIGVEEALLFSNSQRVHNDYLRDGRDKLVAYLKTFVSDHEKVIKEAYLSVLSRKPDDEEMKRFAQFLSARKEVDVSALQTVVWALMTSPEFRFNH